MYGVIVYNPIHRKRGRMKNITQVQIPKNFFITYYANKHEKFITRRGQFNKPDSDTQGKYFISNEGKPCFIYWDLDATPSSNGNQWRMATWAMTIKERTI